MKTYKILFTSLCVAALFSCDSYLDTPPLHQLSENVWWNNEKQAKLMVDNCYAQLPDHNIIPFRDGYSDNAIWRSQNLMGDGSMTAFAGKVKDEWKYAKIAQLNYVLEGLEKAKGTLSEDTYAHLRAEVRFIRAYLYYDMLFFFGDVPLVTKVLTVDESRQTGRTPRAEVLSFVLNELNEVLVDIKRAPNEDSGRVNEQVVNAYLSRVYLYEKNYDKVLEHTKAVMDSGKYGLYRAFDKDLQTNSYEELFRPQNDGSTNEVIFEVQYNNPLKLSDINRNLSASSSPYTGWGWSMPTEDLVDDYECIEGHALADCEKLGCKHVAERAAIEAQGLFGEYEYRDPRLKSTIVTPGWEWKVDGKVSFTFNPEDKDNPDHIQKKPWSTGYVVTKWVDMKGANADRTKAYKNITLIRYADVMLMRAEALIEKNENLQEAANLINEIRDRARMPKNIMVTNQADMREKLRHERRIELAIEGLRYYDIIRWRICDKVKNGDVYGFAMMNEETGKRENIFMEKRIWKDHMYVWPVPQDALDLNQSLKQNTGW